MSLMLMTHAPETGARNWRRFLAPVSGACVRGITSTYFAKTHAH